MKKLVMVLMALALSLPVFAGGSQETADDGVVKVALILPSTADDQGWSQTMYDSAIRVVDEYEGKMIAEYSENMKPVDAGSAARQYIAQGFQYIVFHGSQFNNSVVELAEEFPEIVFVFGTSAQVVADNVISYQPGTEEPGYLSGIAAGMATKTNKIGIVGPVDGGDAAQYNRGFWLGVESVNPDAEIAVAHTGSYGDFVKAGELAQSYISDGYDMLAGSAQQGLGALQAVAQHPDEEVYWMGTSELQFEGSEGYKLLAGCTYFYDPLFKEIMETELAGGKVEGGRVFWMTIPNGGFTFSLSKDSPVITDDIRAAVAAARDELVAGTLEIDWKSVNY